MENDGIIIGELPMEYIVVMARLKINGITLMSFYNNVTFVDCDENETQIDYIFKTGLSAWPHRFKSIVINLN